MTVDWTHPGEVLVVLGIGVVGITLYAGSIWTLIESFTAGSVPEMLTAAVVFGALLFVTGVAVVVAMEDSE